ncbi:MAG: hypothetical protein Q8S24_10790 [Eubacteriales bacterium]|nr:hypothetical protein [Eubacteriales bacterium]
MANKTLNARLVTRNNTAANFASTNPILLAGEMGMERDTKKFKFGDGITAWNALPYASANPAVIKTTNPATTDSTYDLGVVWLNTASKKGFLLTDNTPGAAVWKQIVTSEDIVTVGDMTKAVFATIDPAAGYVDKAKTADKLASTRQISLGGDASGSVNFDGSANVTLSAVLANVVAAGVATKITVDAKGRVTAIHALEASDIPAITLSKVTDAGSAASKNVGNAVGNVVVVAADGKIDSSLIPAIALTDVFEAASQAAMLALSGAEKGDICVRSDLNKSFILKQAPYSNLDNWVELKTPTDAVLSVNGQTGAITLTTSHIAEGTNLYWTQARFDTAFSAKASTALSDSADLIYKTDTLILDGGN